MYNASAHNCQEILFPEASIGVINLGLEPTLSPPTDGLVANPTFLSQLNIPLSPLPTVERLDVRPYIYGTPNADRIEGSDIGESIYGLDGNDTIYGNGGHDRIYGNGGSDFIRGGSGSDTLQGHGGDDFLGGGEGDDGLDGGEGNDRLFGGTGDDRLYGENGDDQLAGADGDDILDGGDGNDGFQGGRGDDTLFGGDGNDWLAGDEGNDFVCGGAGGDQLFGNAGDDILFGGLGSDYVRGGAGNDWIQGATENSVAEFDILVGGADPGDTLNADGADTFVLGDASGAFYTESSVYGSFDPFGPWAMLDGYATIREFNRVEGDTIQMSGDASLYVIGQGDFGGDSGILDAMIYRQMGSTSFGQTGFNYERVGLVMDVFDLSLTADFSFV